MNISVGDLGSAIEDLVSRAEAGEEVILTREGRPTVRLQPVRRQLTPEDRRKVLDAALALADRMRTPGPSGAELQAALYDEDGLPA